MESFTTTHRGKRLAIFAFMFEHRTSQVAGGTGDPANHQGWDPDLHSGRAKRRQSLIKGLNNAVKSKPYVFSRMNMIYRLILLYLWLDAVLLRRGSGHRRL